jgi:hypothetical protein
MESGDMETSQPAPGMARIRLICYGARLVIKGFLKTATQSLCTPIMGRKPFSALFWLLLNVTASGGQQESFPWTRMPLTVLCSKLESIAKKY